MGFPLLPDAQMGVHTRAIVIIKGFGHEGDGVIVFRGNVF